MFRFFIYILFLSPMILGCGGESKDSNKVLQDESISVNNEKKNVNLLAPPECWCRYEDNTLNCCKNGEWVNVRKITVENSAQKKNRSIQEFHKEVWCSDELRKSQNSLLVSGVRRKINFIPIIYQPWYFVVTAEVISIRKQKKVPKNVALLSVHEVLLNDGGRENEPRWYCGQPTISLLEASGMEEGERYMLFFLPMGVFSIIPFNREMDGIGLKLINWNDSTVYLVKQWAESQNKLILIQDERYFKFWSSIDRNAARCFKYGFAWSDCEESNIERIETLECNSRSQTRIKDNNEGRLKNSILPPQLTIKQITGEME